MKGFDYIGGKSKLEEMKQYTVNDLKTRRLQSLIQAEKGVLHFPVQYKELKSTLDFILNHKLDVNEYFEVAEHITKLLETLSLGATVGLFGHFEKEINPVKKGNVRYFRFECRDLLNQLMVFEKWRKEKRNIRVLK